MIDTQDDILKRKIMFIKMRFMFKFNKEETHYFVGKIIFTLLLFCAFLPAHSRADMTAAECGKLGGSCKTTTTGSCPGELNSVGICSVTKNLTQVCCALNIKPPPPSTPSNYKYTPLEPIFAGDTDGGFVHYIQMVYKFLIWTVGIAALLMLTIGGFMYMTSAGNQAHAETAKKIIKDALLGLVIVLFTWVLLNLINPDLVKINLKSVDGLKYELKDPKEAGGTTGTHNAPGQNGNPAPVPTGEQYSHDEAAAILKGAGIDLYSSGSCTDPTKSNCTSLEGIPKSTVDNLLFLKAECPSCNFTITGGTETGHGSHGAGRAIVDIREDANFYSNLQKWKSEGTLGDHNITKICSTAAKSDVSYNCGGYTEKEKHFHVVFGS